MNKERMILEARLINCLWELDKILSDFKDNSNGYGWYRRELNDISDLIGVIIASGDKELLLHALRTTVTYNSVRDFARKYNLIAEEHEKKRKEREKEEE